MLTVIKEHLKGQASWTGATPVREGGLAFYPPAPSLHCQHPTPQIWQLVVSGSTEAAALRTRCRAHTVPREEETGLRTAQQLLLHASKCGTILPHRLLERFNWDGATGGATLPPVVSLLLQHWQVNTYLV